jgi:serine/threonine-protein kinase RsbW
MKIIADEIEVIIGSALGNLDLVQTLTDCITNFMRFNEDSAHWISMSVREAVTNAIQHGNKLDLRKGVDIRFELSADQLAIYIRDQGEGFRIEDLPNPLDAANLLKPSGRGIFYIRSFMDQVDFKLLPQGGMEVYMVKKVSN